MPVEYDDLCVRVLVVTLVLGLGVVRLTLGFVVSTFGLTGAGLYFGLGVAIVFLVVIPCLT